MYSLGKPCKLLSTQALGSFYVAQSCTVMRDFYENFYRTVAASPVHATFCTRCFGQNLAQHGFADMAQLDALLKTVNLRPGHCALDLGCGNGLIAEYIAEHTGAHLTGLDYIPEAIRQAQARTVAKRPQLDFMVGDINALALPSHAFDVIISIDTMYFSNDYTATIGQLLHALRSGGQLAFFFAHGWGPWLAVEAFDSATLAPDKTPLGVALRAHGLAFTVQDFTAADYRLAQVRKQVLTELKPQFEAENLMFIYENRLGDANGVSRAVELQLHRRYLYHVQLAP